jgi:DNA-binding transcriptional ArsR family regulator
MGGAVLGIPVWEEGGVAVGALIAVRPLENLCEPLRVDIFLYRNIILRMARAATTADAFNAVAEPRRRQILDVLAGGERPVNDLVRQLRLAQPQVSKHLRVLREVGAVDVREEGRQRLYRLNGEALKPIHDWVKSYERLWSDRFDQLDVVLEELKQREEEGDGSYE